MAYDGYGGHQAPRQDYYNRPNHRTPAPQAQVYDDGYGYSQNQDPGYSQGGYDGYNDPGQGQQYGQQQQYGNGGYDNGYQRGPQQQGAFVQKPPPQQRQLPPRNNGYGGPPPPRLNLPPQGRQDMFPNDRNTFPLNIQPQMTRPPQAPGPRSHTAGADYGRQGHGQQPASPLGGPWLENNGRSSPFDPFGERSGQGSLREHPKREDSRKQPLTPRRRDSDIALPMDNPFPDFPTKNNIRQARTKNDPVVEEAMSVLSLNGSRLSGDGDEKSLSTFASNQKQTPNTSPPRVVQRAGNVTQSPPRSTQQHLQGGRARWGSGGASDGYGQVQKQVSWPVAAAPTEPPMASFQAPPRPFTATGVRVPPGGATGGSGRGPAGGGFDSQSQYNAPPPQRRRSMEGGYQQPPPQQGGNGYDMRQPQFQQPPPQQQGGNGYDMRQPRFQQPPPPQPPPHHHQQQQHGGNGYDMRQPQFQQPPPQHGGMKQYGAAYAAPDNRYDDYGANTYADDGSHMPNFDMGPNPSRNEHSISMHFDGGPVQGQQRSPPRQQRGHAGPGPQNSYGDDYYGYGQDSQQMYNHSYAQSEPDLRGGNPNGYYQNGPLPSRGPSGRGMGPPGPGGPGRGPLGRGMPPGGPGMPGGPRGGGFGPPGGAGGRGGRPGPPAMSRLQTGGSQFSDAGSRGGSPMSAGPRGMNSGSMAPLAVYSDALPSHPAPVRPGLMEKSVDTPIADGPVTEDEIGRLADKVRMDPNDFETMLFFAKRLAIASTELTKSITDVRVRLKQKERYIFEATKFLKKLVSQGHPEAMFYMADCHGQGLLGLEPDPKEAFRLYQQAAKLGHPASAYRTAVCCEMGADDGGGTRKDPLKAVQWYRRAASLGEPAGMYKLGMVLLKGLLGTQRNVGEAVNWLQRAANSADRENPHALHELAQLYANPPLEGLLKRDEKYAAQLFEKAARLGYKFSQFKLGEAFEYGLLGLPADQRSSIAWYSKAAAQEEHQSELSLSGWYLTGAPGILDQNDQEAYLWARKAAQAELPKGMFAMGYYTEVGIGCPRSLEEAKRWYGRAAALRYTKAQERLEELKKGGARVQKSRERLSRTGRRQHDDNCVVM